VHLPNVFGMHGPLATDN